MVGNKDYVTLFVKIIFLLQKSQQLNKLDQHHPKSLLLRLADQLQRLMRGMVNVEISNKFAEILKKRKPILLFISLCSPQVDCFVPDDQGNITT